MVLLSCLKFQSLLLLWSLLSSCLSNTFGERNERKKKTFEGEKTLQPTLSQIQASKVIRKKKSPHPIQVLMNNIVPKTIQTTIQTTTTDMDVPIEVITKKLKVFCSTANLGPGFDVIGLGLTLSLSCLLTYPSTKTTITTDNPAITLNPLENLITKTTQFVANVYQRKLMNYSISITSDIPLSRGLGSSASAIILGILIASELLHLSLTKKQICDLGTIIEGHPDNISASVYGSLTISIMKKEIEFREEWYQLGFDCGFLRKVVGDLTETTVLEINGDIKITCIIPDFELSTSKARAVLPTLYPRSSLIHNLSRSLTLITQITLPILNIPLLQECFSDRIHQSFRAGLIPGLEEVLGIREEKVLGICLSGAGPTVVVFHVGFGCKAVKEVFGRSGVECRVVEMGVSKGFEVY